MKNHGKLYCTGIGHTYRGFGSNCQMDCWRSSFPRVDSALSLHSSRLSKQLASIFTAAHQQTRHLQCSSGLQYSTCIARLFHLEGEPRRHTCAEVCKRSSCAAHCTQAADSVRLALVCSTPQRRCSADAARRSEQLGCRSVQHPGVFCQPRHALAE
jgi:hypothetical protein